MRVVLASSFQRALQRWPATALLFLGNLLPALAFTAVAWRWMSIALDGSLATRTLLTDLDMNVFVDLFAHHHDSLAMLLANALSIAVVFAVVFVWLNGTAILAVSERRTLNVCAARSFALTPRFLGLWAITVLSQAAAAACAAGGVRFLLRYTAESPSEAATYLAVAAPATLGLLAAVFLGTVHDHARVYCGATQSAVLEAYAWALRFVVRVERRAFPMGLVVLFVVGVSWVVYQSVAMVVPTNIMPGVVLALLWGQVFVLLRLFGRLWAFALAAELQERFELGSP